MESPNELLRRFRDIVKMRGVKGLITFQKILKMTDIQGTQRITIQEFKKALRDFKIENLQDQEVTKLFNLFDKQRSGYINYKEFIRAIRDELNDFRRDLVERVFIILDRDDDGVVDIQDIKYTFNAKRHPDVM
jgi:Ca2+-binding EF-hand superfamily protein